MLSSSRKAETSLHLQNLKMSCVEGLGQDILVLARLSLSFDFSSVPIFLRLLVPARAPLGSIRAGPGSQEQGSRGAPGQPQLRALGTCLGTGTG